MILGALEAGGTKMVLAAGNEKGEIFHTIEIPTTTPEETMPKMIDFFQKEHIEALGIGCFGPIDVNENSAAYGYITSTPKLAWVNYPIVKEFKDALNVPVGFDTDVNSSALGEAVFGGMKGLKSGLYLTIGTGVGAGIISEGKLLHNMMHPEAGHIMLRNHVDDTFAGICPYHHNCLEGLASGPAIEKRWGEKADLLKENQTVWEWEAYYIAQALMNYILIVSPEKIVLGGGVMHQEQLFPLIRKELAKLLNGYIKTKEIMDMDTYVVPASLHGNQGIMGCLELAARAGKQ